MTDTKATHEERTSHEPREATLHSVVLSKITPVGSLVRLFRLQVPGSDPDVKFLPGQWIDTFCPGTEKAGGFTITSPPSKAATDTSKKSASSPPGRYIELAVKASPENPAAVWLWQDPKTILGQTLRIRVGGSFVFPPDLSSSSTPLDQCRFVFVAGGVGINPLISMVSYLAELNAAAAAQASETGATGPEVVFLYSARADAKASSGDEEEEEESTVDRIPFLQHLASLFSREQVRGQLKLFLTGSSGEDSSGVLSGNEEDIPFEQRRITTADLDAAVKGEGSNATGGGNVYVYICSLPTMTDAFVAHLSEDLGLPKHQILFEKWW